jgi:hypothetical protein
MRATIARNRTCLTYMLTSAAIVAACAEPPNVVSPPALPSTALAAPPEEWTYEILGNPTRPNEMPFMTHAVNDSGHITGIAGYPITVAWRWRKGVFQTTPPVAGSFAVGRGINNNGDVFGTRRTNNDLSWHGMAWHFTPGGSSMADFLPVTPGARVEGQDINDHGLAIGYECEPDGSDDFCKYRALLWRPTQTSYPWKSDVIALGPIGTRDRGLALNNVGMGIGSTLVGGEPRAWVTLDGVTELLPLGDDYFRSWPGDINDSYTIVGVAARRRDGRTRFVKWIGASLPIDLGIPLDPDAYPHEHAPIRVSNTMRIAGTSGFTPFTFKNGVMTYLPIPLGADIFIGGINTCGTIVGTATYSGPTSYAIRWRRTVHGQLVCD